MKNLHLLALFSILLFFGCATPDDEDPEDDTMRSFNVSISGDQTGDLKGEAIFLHAIVSSKTDDENGSSLGVTLIDETNEDNIIVITVLEAGYLNGIGVGSYDVDFDGKKEDSFATVAMYIDGSLLTFLATSGEVNLTKVQDKKVEGTVTATLTNFKTETIAISGSYMANGITQKL